MTRPGRRSWNRTSWPHVMLALLGGILGVLLARFLFPVVLESSFLFALVVIALFAMAVVLAFRAYGRGADS